MALSLLASEGTASGVLRDHGSSWKHDGGQHQQQVLRKSLSGQRGQQQVQQALRCHQPSLRITHDLLQPSLRSRHDRPRQPRQAPLLVRCGALLVQSLCSKRQHQVQEPLGVRHQHVQSCLLTLRPAAELLAGGQARPR